MDDADWSPSTLDEARIAIDAVDARMLELLHQRARIVGHVGRIKRAASASPSANAFRPARELQMLRHLVTRTKAPLSFSTVYAIWREIVSGFTAAQMPLVIAATPATATLARDTFGAHARLSILPDAAAVLAAMDADAGTIGLIGVTETDWTALAAQDAKIVARAPFFGQGIDAWCLSHTPLGASGEDATVIAAPKGQNLPGTHLAHTDSHAIHTVDGFHATDPASLGVDTVQILGAYPLPLDSGAIE